MTLFPYFGSKRAAAPLVWRALGDPDTYIEPFAGSLAVLLARPNPIPRWELAADTDGLVVNAWRAIREEPLRVLAYDQGPIAEADIEAWHRHLIAHRAELMDNLRMDPSYYDPQMAFYWWAGASSWLGSGWCRSDDPERIPRQRPHVDRTLKGLYAEGCTNAKVLAIAARLANVVLTAGDWSSVCTESILNRFGTASIGVFLDPPYTHVTGRGRLYTEDTPLSEQVQQWSLDHDHMRVVVAGYRSEYPRLIEAGWTTTEWRTPSGYVYRSGNQRRDDDVLFCSPVCVTQSQLQLEER